MLGATAGDPDTDTLPKSNGDGHYFCMTAYSQALVKRRALIPELGGIKGKPGVQTGVQIAFQK